MIRLFTGLAPSEQCKGSLSLLACSVEGVRWISRENQHLTLVFIGEVDRSTYHAVIDALAACQGEPFELIVSGGGHFGSSRNPRTLWAGVEPNPALMQLQETIHRQLSPLVALERRQFRPHITLARLKRCPATELARLLESVHHVRCPPETVDEFILYSSRLGARGSEYQVEARFSLAAPG